MSVSQDAWQAASRLATARALQVDGFTAEVVRGLQGRGIQCVLLKGPALASWLYDDGTARSYIDSDLLVSPADWDAAEDELRTLGYREDETLEPPPRHARAWIRPSDGAKVDLHRSLAAVSIGDAHVWRVVAGTTESMIVGGVQVQVPRLAARALIVALHAAHHGGTATQPLEDLRRAVARVSFQTWVEAENLAEQLNAGPTMALGLRLDSEGAKLARRLGLASPQLVDAAITHGSSGRIALGFERLAARRGLRSKLRLLFREAFPSREFQRWWWPPARRGRVWLVVAYGRRLLWLLWHALPSAWLWFKSRRTGRQPSRDGSA